MTDKELIKKDMDTYAALIAVQNTEAGQVLRRSLAADVISNLSKIAYGDDADLPKLKYALRASFELWTALTNAQTNFDDADARLKELTE